MEVHRQLVADGLQIEVHLAVDGVAFAGAVEAHRHHGAVAFDVQRFVAHGDTPVEVRYPSV
jgi:hypothetical protein